jgi:hypothetical protein
MSDPNTYPATANIEYSGSASSADGLDYNADANNYGVNIHRMVNLYPFYYQWSTSHAYQLNPDYVVHYANINPPNGVDPSTVTLAIELPYISAYVNDRCLHLIYLRSTLPGCTFRLTCVDITTSFNKGAAGVAHDFITDDQDHLFFVYGTYQGALSGPNSGNYINKYFVKALQGREITLTAGTGINIAQSNPGQYTIALDPKYTHSTSSLWFGNMPQGTTAAAYDPFARDAVYNGVFTKSLYVGNNATIDKISYQIEWNTVDGTDYSGATVSFRLKKINPADHTQSINIVEGTVNYPDETVILIPTNPKPTVSVGDQLILQITKFPATGGATIAIYYIVNFFVLPR